MGFIEIIDLLGTIAFAISGALAAFSKKLDPFGIIIIAFVTAAGGGTLRDVLIGVRPVSWMLNMDLVYTILICVLVTFIFRKWLQRVNMRWIVTLSRKRNPYKRIAILIVPPAPYKDQAGSI